MKKKPNLPLEGITVTSLEHAVGAPLASRLLADLGAEVIKIERPGKGDFARYWDRTVNGLSSYFVWLNRNKKSITLNLKTNQGKSVLEELLRKSDVFIQNLGPGVIDKIGFDPKRVMRKHPKLIFCSLSGYGQSGPYKDEKAYDLLIQGESGLISLTGYDDRPAKVGISIADISSGLYAALAVLSALIRKDNTRKGCFIDASMFESMLDLVAGPALYSNYSGVSPKREGMRHNIIVPYGPFLSSDGKYVNIAVENDEEWRVFCDKIVSRHDLIDDLRFSSNELRLKNRLELEPIIESIFLAKTSDEWWKLLHDADIACGRVNDLSELWKHPQLEHRKILQELKTEHGVISAISSPVKISGVKLPMKQVPSLGQDTVEVLKNLGYNPKKIKEFAQNGVI